jgi:hypothetical protein
VDGWRQVSCAYKTTAKANFQYGSRQGVREMTDRARAEIHQRSQEILAQILADPLVRAELRKWTQEELSADHSVPLVTEWMDGEA